MSNLIARPLSGEQIVQAFVLVQGLYPELSMNEWCRVSARDRGKSGTELMSLQTINGSVHALFFCRQTEDLLYGSVLQVDHVIVYDLPGRSEALRTVIRVAEQMARERGCDAVDVTVPRSKHASVDLAQGLVGRLENEGYLEHGIQLRRMITRAVAS